jgi:uncharacterized protein (DUF1330 family)
VKTKYTVALAMLVGVVIGGAAIQGLHAQAKPPSLVVIDISDVTDPGGFKAVTERTQATRMAALKEFGGRYVARTQKITALDGTAPKRMIIIAFDSPEKAQGWNSSTAQKEINTIRAKTTKSRSFIVEGEGM